MNRLEFLTSLRYNLEKGGLPRADIEDALSYYEEIFFDSGYGSDEQTVSMLGSPEALAREILIDNGFHPDGDAAYQLGEADRRAYSGAQDVQFEEVGKENNSNTQSGYDYGYGYGTGNTSGAGQAQNAAGFDFNEAAGRFGQFVDGVFTTAKNVYDKQFNDPSMTDVQKSKRNNVILKVLILLLTAPIWGSIVVGIIGAIVGILGGLLSVIVSLIAGGFSLVISGIVDLFRVTPIGVVEIGGGLLLLGIFGLVARPAFRGLTKLCKWIFGGIKKLFCKFFR